MTLNNSACFGSGQSEAANQKPSQPRKARQILGFGKKGGGPEYSSFQFQLVKNQLRSRPERLPLSLVVPLASPVPLFIISRAVLLPSFPPSPLISRLDRGVLCINPGVCAVGGRRLVGVDVGGRWDIARRESASRSLPSRFGRAVGRGRMLRPWKVPAGPVLSPRQDDQPAVSNIKATCSSRAAYTHPSETIRLPLPPLSHSLSLAHLGFSNLYTRAVSTRWLGGFSAGDAVVVVAGTAGCTAASGVWHVRRCSGAIAFSSLIPGWAGVQ